MPLRDLKSIDDVPIISAQHPAPKFHVAQKVPSYATIESMMDRRGSNLSWLMVVGTLVFLLRTPMDCGIANARIGHDFISMAVELCFDQVHKAQTHTCFPCRD